MKNEFYIYKSSIIENSSINLDFIPMLIRRRLSELTKIAFLTLYECYEDNNINLIFASKNGEFKNLEKLINSYQQYNEVSPSVFSNSVHNAAIGMFTLLNKITKSYNAVSSKDNTISNGLIDAISNDKMVLFCYADIIPIAKSVSCLLGKEYRNSAQKCEIISKSNNGFIDEYTDFVKFLKGESDTFDTYFYQIRRLDV